MSLFICSLLERTMRDDTIQILGEDWRLRLGSHAGNVDLRQDAETAEHRIRQLSDKVSAKFSALY